MTLRVVFSENVKRVRTAKGISQEELAFRCGLHRTYISDIERATRNISVDNIERIATALEVSPIELLGGTYAD